MSRTEQIFKLIKSLSNTTPDVEGAALIDNDGLVIASALPADADEDTTAAMGAAMLGLGERIVDELSRGEFEMVMLRGSSGLVLMVRCGPDAVLAVLAAKRAKLGLIFLDVKRTAKQLVPLVA